MATAWRTASHGVAALALGAALVAGRAHAQPPAAHGHGHAHGAVDGAPASAAPLPEPADLLAAADALRLSAAQRARLDSIRVRGERVARAGSADVADWEAKLALLLARRPVDAAQAEGIVRAIGALRADVAWVRLRARIEALAVLDEAQRGMLDRIRPEAAPAGEAPAARPPR